MTSPEDDVRFARLAARALASDDVAMAPVSLGDRAATVAGIERALRARGRRRLRAWAAAAIPAAAALVVVAVGWQRLHAPARGTGTSSTLTVAAIEGAGAMIDADGDSKPAALRDAIPAGSRLTAPASGDLTLALDTGTRLRLAGSSRARVVALGAMQRFDLDSGTFAAEVAKLGPGRRFLIATPDAEVEVKGTKFEVAVGPEPSACAPRVRTRVTVQEGVVAVRSQAGEVQLAAGATWPACAPEERAASSDGPAPVSPAAAVRHAKTGVQRTGVALPPADRTPPPASTLAEQNDLFAAALAASRRGDAAEALDWLNRLLARYPNGQLVDSARAERRRLLQDGARNEPGPGR